MEVGTLSREATEQALSALESRDLLQVLETMGERFKLEMADAWRRGTGETDRVSLARRFLWGGSIEAHVAKQAEVMETVPQRDWPFGMRELARTGLDPLVMTRDTLFHFTVDPQLTEYAEEDQGAPEPVTREGGPADAPSRVRMTAETVTHENGTLLAECSATAERVAALVSLGNEYTSRRLVPRAVQLEEPEGSLVPGLGLVHEPWKPIDRYEGAPFVGVGFVETSGPNPNYFYVNPSGKVCHSPNMGPGRLRQMAESYLGDLSRLESQAWGGYSYGKAHGWFGSMTPVAKVAVSKPPRGGGPRW